MWRPEIPLGRRRFLTIGPAVDGHDRVYLVHRNTIVNIWLLPKWLSFMSRRWR